MTPLKLIGLWEGSERLSQMPNSSPLQFGRKLTAGRYTFLKSIGRGGMGEVWLARAERLDEWVVDNTWFRQHAARKDVLDLVP